MRRLVRGVDLVVRQKFGGAVGPPVLADEPAEDGTGMSRSACFQYNGSVPRRLLPLLVALATAAPAQTVWSMGAPWTDLAAVLAAAAPGDIVRLNGLTFPPFTMTKGLTIVGPGTIQPAASSGPVQSTVTVPAGQFARFADVEFAPQVFALGLGFTPHAVAADGAITFDGCRFRQGHPCNLSTSGSVLLNRCQVFGDPLPAWPQPVGGMQVHSGLCSLVDCDVDGGNSIFQSAWPYSVASTPGLRVNGGTVLASRTSFDGGAGRTLGVFGASAGSSGVIVLAGSCSLADCTVAAGASPNAISPPSLATAVATFVARTTLAASTGPASSGPVQSEPELVGLGADLPLQLGQTSTFTAIAGSTGWLAILAGFDGNAYTHPEVLDPFVGAPQQQVLLTLSLPTAGSSVPRPILVPNASTLVGFGLYVQAFQLVANGVRASAAVGCVVR